MILRPGISQSPGKADINFPDLIGYRPDGKDDGAIEDRDYVL
jgi:hypothetical protein